MGAQATRQNFYTALMTPDYEKVTAILNEKPEFLNQAMTENCESTALVRATWRQDKKMIELLIEKGAQVNFTGPNGLTPLMRAIMRNNTELTGLLIGFGAEIDIQNKEGLDSLNLSIAFGNYACALFLLEKFPQEITKIKKVSEFTELQQENKWRYVNYEVMLDNLKAKVPVDQTPQFLTAPPQPQMIDPVINPHESWGDWFKRIKDFHPPPMVERHSLEVKKQPQNHFWGKFTHYINGKDLHKSQEQRYYTSDLDNTNKQMASNERNVQLDLDNQDKIITVEQRGNEQVIQNLSPNKNKEYMGKNYEGVQISMENNASLDQKRDGKQAEFFDSINK